MNYDVGALLLSSFNNALIAVTTFVPKFVLGLIILLVGIIIASILKQVVLQVANILRIEPFLRRYGVPEGREDFNWSNILAEIVRWFVILMFLIPTAEAWGLPQINSVLTTFLLYLPNVFVAAIIILVGFVLAKLTHDVIVASTQSLTGTTSRAIASASRWAIIIFAVLAALNQLGIASDLVRILFTGLVAMIALAGGIAFGLGGQTAAKTVLEDLMKAASAEKATPSKKK